MVAMASDSYLLKTAAQPPCQACCRASDSTACRATSCGVVVTLVLLLAAVVGLGGVLYYQRMMLCSVLADLSSMERIIQRVDTNIVRLHQELQYKTFGVEHKDPEEEEALSDDSDGDGDSDDVDYDLADYDDGLLYQNNNPMGTTTPRSEDNEPLARDRHSVLGQGKNGLATTPAILKETESDSSEARGTGETDEGHIWRWRRDVGLATGRRADPQLRLYHMLQAPDHAVPFAAAPEGTWSQRGQHRGPGFLPMYAEHAPLEYVMPPRANIATTPSPIASRRSRVMAGPPAAAVPGRLQPSQFDRHPHQHGQLEGAEAARRQDGRATRRRRPSPTQAQAVPSRGPWRGVRSIDTSVDVDQTWRPYVPTVVEGPAVAAHFVGDSSRHRNSHHYDDNGRLKHPTGEYADWRASPWMRELGLDHHFRLGDSGTHVVVDTPGLYLVYAQVNYSNEKDDNGFWVYRNGLKELLCATTGPGAHTCFTAGVLHLGSGDRVTLRDLAGDRYRVLDHPGRSFIGLVNLSACKLKSELSSRATSSSRIIRPTAIDTK